MGFLKKPIKGNRFILHFDIALILSKLVLTLCICSFLKVIIHMEAFWIFLVWIGVGFVFDTLIFLGHFKFLSQCSLDKEEVNRFKISSEELIRYFPASSLIRTFRNATLILVILCFTPKIDWPNNLFWALCFGFLAFDPICRKILNIKAPLIFTPNRQPLRMESTHERYRNDPYFYGSDAWVATHNHREDQYFHKF